MLREELDDILQLFYKNAAELSPLVQEPRHLVSEYNRDTLDHKSFPDCLEQVAEAFEELRERLNEFHDYTVGFQRHPLAPLSYVYHQVEIAQIKNPVEIFAKDLKVSINLQVIVQVLIFVMYGQYRAVCIHQHRSKKKLFHVPFVDLFRWTDQLGSPPIRNYVHSLADEMGKDLDNLVHGLKTFKQYGKR
jgi:hypothetical protein